MPFNEHYLDVQKTSRDILTHCNIRIQYNNYYTTLVHSIEGITLERMRKILEFEKFFKKGGGSGHGNSIGAVFFFPPKVINVRIWSSLLRLQVEKNQ